MLPRIGYVETQTAAPSVEIECARLENGAFARIEVRKVDEVLKETHEVTAKEQRLFHAGNLRIFTGKRSVLLNEVGNLLPGVTCEQRLDSSHSQAFKGGGRFT